MSTATMACVFGLAITPMACAQTATLTLLPAGYLPTDIHPKGMVVGTSASGPFFMKASNQPIQIIPSGTNLTPPAFELEDRVGLMYKDAIKPAQPGTYHTALKSWIALHGGLSGIGPQGQLAELLGQSAWSFTGRGWIAGQSGTVALTQTPSGALAALPSLAPNLSACGLGTIDGEQGSRFVVGWQALPSGFQQGSRWIDGVQSLFVDSSGQPCGPARAVTEINLGFENEFCVVGEAMADGSPWVWKPSTGVVPIGPVPQPGWTGVAVDCYFFGHFGGEGEAVVGAYRDVQNAYHDAFVVLPSQGYMRLDDFAALHGVAIPPGFEFAEVRAAADGPGGNITSGGLHAVGVGRLNGVPVGWVLAISYCDQICYCDMNDDCSATIDDFIEFQTLFALGEPRADCDSDGKFTIDDYICFQTFFVFCCD